MPFACRAVGVELVTEQRVVSLAKLGSSDTVKQWRIVAQPSVYSPPMGTFYQDLLALDVPILLPLPEVPPSGYSEVWGASTVHFLNVRFTAGTSAQQEQVFVVSFPVPIKVYDTLPLYRQFNETVVETTSSPDKQVLVELQVPVSAVGPRDEYSVDLRIFANSQIARRKKKLTLKLVSALVKEIMEGHDSGLPARKEQKLFLTVKEFETRVTTNSESCSIGFRFPYENDLLLLYSLVNTRNYQDADVNLHTAAFNHNRNFSKLRDGVPLSHTQGFTLLGKLYSLRYELSLNVKVGHGKDIDINLPITVSPYDRSSCIYLLSWIKEECNIARERFGKFLVAKLVQNHHFEETTLELSRYAKPPVLYYYKTSDWNRLGLNPNFFGKGGPDAMTVSHID